MQRTIGKNRQFNGFYEFILWKGKKYNGLNVLFVMVFQRKIRFSLLLFVMTE